jgi:Mg2+/Co2+ transporter CorB
MNQPTQSKENPLLVIRLIWGGLVASILAYAFLAEQAAGPMIPGLTLDFDHPTHLALSVMSIVMVVMSVILPKRIAAQAQTKSLNNAFAPLIVRMAILEAITIFGLVLSFTDEVNHMMPFVSTTLIGFFMNFPTENGMKRIAGI